MSETKSFYRQPDVGRNNTCVFVCRRIERSIIADTVLDGTSGNNDRGLFQLIACTPRRRDYATVSDAILATVRGDSVGAMSGESVNRSGSRDNFTAVRDTARDEILVSAP